MNGNGLGVRVLRASDRSPFPFVVHNTVPYVIAEPGAAFVIEATRDPGLHHYQTILVSLKMDGRSAGYSKTMSSQHTTSHFEGFCIDQINSTYQQFEFASAAAVVAAADPALVKEVSDPAQMKSGRITATFNNCRASHLPPAPLTGRTPVEAADAEKLPENKKFYMSASLLTAPGKTISVSSNWCNVRYEAIGPPVLDLVVCYETASTLLLRGILCKDNPAHRALLLGSRDPMVKALLCGEGDEQPGDRARQRKRKKAAAAADGPAAAVAAAMGDATAGGGVKRERGARGAAGADGGSGGGGGGGGPAFTLDLTEAPHLRAIKLEGGKAVGKDEVACCDLTGDDPGAEGVPLWRVTKKAHH